MIGGELWHHFTVIVILTALVSRLVVWRYRVVILSGMNAAAGQILPISPASQVPSQHLEAAEKGNAEDWERAVHCRVIIAWLVSVSIASPFWAIPLLASLDSPISPAHLVLVGGVALSAAVPMIAASLAWPFWRGIRFWVCVLAAGAIAAVSASVLQRILTGKTLTPDPLMNTVVFLQLSAATLWLPALLLLAIGSAKLRGVVHITFVGLFMFGLASFLFVRLFMFGLTPFLGWNATDVFLQMQAGPEAIRALPSWLFPHAVFFLLALPTGWAVWNFLQRAVSGYAAKRFSDVQMLARMWWLMFIVIEAIEILNARPDRWWYTAGGVMSYVVFAQTSLRVFGWLGVTQNSRAPRTLLLLRIFGYTARTEKLFDRIGARWRYFGPVTMIAAPDVVARTLDPGDYLHFITGSVDQTFVRSATDLQRRLAEMDMARDPDGRYRVNEFCCADNTWQATIVELMQRCDAVLMDLRGITHERRGCEFELQQLTARVAANRIVLVVDVATDRAMVCDALGKAANAVTFFELRDSRPKTTTSLFHALLHAAH